MEDLLNYNVKMCEKVRELKEYKTCTVVGLTKKEIQMIINMVEELELEEQKSKK